MKFEYLSLMSTLEGLEITDMSRRLTASPLKWEPRRNIFIHYTTTYEWKGDILTTNKHFSHFSKGDG